MTNKARIKISGVNIFRIYKIFRKNNLEISNVDNIDHKTVEFDIDGDKTKQVFLMLKNSNYKVSVVNRFGLTKFFHFMLHNFGYVVGIVVFIICIIFSNFFVTDIKIYGTNNISSEDVIAVLKENGISNGKLINQIEIVSVKSLLEANFDEISLLSVAKKGTNIIINIKEKQTLKVENNNQKNDIVASKSGTILKIDVIEGTKMFDVGDTFNTGDVLIKGSFIDSNNKEVSCKAQGNIKIRVQYTSTQNFDSNSEIKIRTGKVIKNYEYSIFGLSIKNSIKENTFQSYEEETKNINVFNNNFLPLKLKLTTFFETTTQIIQNDFEKYEKIIVENVKKSANSLVPSEAKIINEFNEIIKVDNGFQVKYTYITDEYI